MALTVLITGSSGLIGRALVARLREQGHGVRLLDVNERDESQGDIRDGLRVGEAVEGCDGVIHLAALSRVVWGEKQPALCHAVNVGGVQRVLEAALAAPLRPWVIFASSREVYGQPKASLVTETAPLRPVSVYGRTKVEGEAWVERAREAGLRASILRLSNVYGSPRDHADRVVPAFARAALLGTPLRVEGPDHAFDFTHVEDVARGIGHLADLLADEAQAPPPIQLTTGVSTRLIDLAEMLIQHAGSASPIHFAPPRTYGVERFCGSRERAQDILGWSPQIPLSQGLSALLHAFAVHLDMDDRFMGRAAPLHIQTH